MSAEPVKVQFYEWGSAILTPPEPGDDPAHPTMTADVLQGVSR